MEWQCCWQTTKWGQAPFFGSPTRRKVPVPDVLIFDGGLGSDPAGLTPDDHGCGCKLTLIGLRARCAASVTYAFHCAALVMSPLRFHAPPA